MADLPRPEDVLSVFLIDDDENAVLLIRETLSAVKGFRFEAEHTRDAQVGLTELIANRYDVYLLADRLGATDGFSVLSLAVKSGCVRPVILLTSRGDFEVGRIALALGAVDYLVKGRLESDTLARTIRYAVERKAFEQRLRDLNYELEQRVQERTVDLTRANDELEAFSYTVSHDLRAPLRAIAATSRVLIEDFKDQLPEEANRLLDRQSKAAVRLGTLIDDLLKLARMSRARPTMAALDVSEVVRIIGLDIELEATDKLVIAPGIRAAGDPALVRSVLANLMENAVKFRHPDRPLVIEVDGKYYGGEVEVSVRDNGLGFSMTYEAKIWEPFQRLVRDEDVPGTGIGLATVRRIVEAHGGRTWAEGKPGEGAAFFFTLPIVRPLV